MTAVDAVVEVARVGLIDPWSLPDPWCCVVWHWLHHHPDRVFLPELDRPSQYLLSWDDLRDILVAAGILESKVSVI